MGPCSERERERKKKKREREREREMAKVPQHFSWISGSLDRQRPRKSFDLSDAQPSKIASFRLRDTLSSFRLISLHSLVARSHYILCSVKEIQTNLRPEILSMPWSSGQTTAFWLQRCFSAVAEFQRSRTRRLKEPTALPPMAKKSASLKTPFTKISFRERKKGSLRKGSFHWRHL